MEKEKNLVIDWIISLLVFYMDAFGIKLPTKVGVLLNKDTKPLRYF